MNTFISYLWMAFAIAVNGIGWLLIYAGASLIIAAYQQWRGHER